MKLNAHNYEAKEIFKIIREWTGLTQEELSNELNHKGRSWAKGIESGHNRYYFDDLLNIAKKHDINIIFEKKNIEKEKATIK